MCIGSLQERDGLYSMRLEGCQNTQILRGQMSLSVVVMQCACSIQIPHAPLI